MPEIDGFLKTDRFKSLNFDQFLMSEKKAGEKKGGCKMGVALLTYSLTPSGVVQSVEAMIPLLTKDGDYLVITREGDSYVLQSSDFVKAYEKAMRDVEAAKDDAIKRGKIEAIESLAERLHLDKPEPETIKILRYRPRN